MIDTLEIRPMAHPTNKHGVYHVARNQFIASFPTCLEAYRFGFGYLNETISQLLGERAAAELPAWDGGGAATGQAMRRAIEGDEAAANARRRDPLRPLYDRQSVARHGS